MHKEVLTSKQLELLSLIKSFKKDFGLVGGTAIALQIGHRQSIDFDLFSNKKIDRAQIRKKILANKKKIDQVLVDNQDEYTVLVAGVKLTFLYYPFKIDFSKKFEDVIKMPDILTLSAMKAYTLGRRAKWKDYVDLYFVIKDHYLIDKIIKKAKKIFGNEFNEKIFRTQLSYFKDIDYTEEIIYLEEFKSKDEAVKKNLIKNSLR
jgi:hypothetical protein